MAYKNIAWEEGQLTFSDLMLFDSHFDVHVKRAFISLDWSSWPHKMGGHIKLCQPHVCILKNAAMPSVKEGGWWDFSLSVEEGTLEWEGLAHFAFADNRLIVDWKDASACLLFIDGKIEADLEHFRAKWLSAFLPTGEIVDGELSGHVQVGSDYKLLSAHLKADHLEMLFPLGSIENLDGALSYNADVGAKWDFKGLGYAQAVQFPLLIQGKSSFVSGWLESEMHFGSSWCAISKESDWKMKCGHLQAAEATLLQTCAIPFFPMLADWKIVQGTLDGEFSFTPDAWSAQFEVANLSCFRGQQPFSCKSAVGYLSHLEGKLQIVADQFELQGFGSWTDWNAQAKAHMGSCVLHGGWDGEKFPIQVREGRFSDGSFQAKGWVDSNLDFSFDVEGAMQVLHQEIPFRCPNLSKRGSCWQFDFRLTRPTWDLVRVMGQYDGQKMRFDSKSHLLGAPLHFTPSPFGEIDVSFKLPHSFLLAAAPFLGEWGVNVQKWPWVSDSEIQMHYQKEHSTIQWACEQMQFVAQQKGEEWDVEIISDFRARATVRKGGQLLGQASWKTGVQIEFDGKVSPTLQGTFLLPKIRLDLSQLPSYGAKGIVEGRGEISYLDTLEAHFDCLVSQLQIEGHDLENRGPLHVDYSSLHGVKVRGIDVQGALSGQVDLLTCDALMSRWTFHHAQMHLPAIWLTHPFLSFLDPENGLDVVADLEIASDLSTFVCTMPEGLIPCAGAARVVADLHLFWGNRSCKATFRHKGELCRLRFDVGDIVQGRLILGEQNHPLAIDWTYDRALYIQSCEGSFGGIEASFHAESPNHLIGSARIHFAQLSNWIPADIGEVFQEIKMGGGYELKGRLIIEGGLPHFRGILAGKQHELFGCQFRTLLAQLDIDPDRVRIYDLKISDTAGSMKIEELLIASRENGPWTISIPQLTLFDVRPSLLQKPGEEVGPISPLVVRELVLKDFQGLLDEGNTYTATGHLHFINSYKRGETVFDYPVNMLSRIVGLDLELLIPVCGDLSFQLKEGRFTLTELAHAFSEGQRSEFFLEMDPPPTMDLDGNLQIFVKMKQFVLLKITESFLISIDGQLSDPQFHLQRRRFFGLVQSSY